MNFLLVGAGGYIAPRHIKAISDTGNTLIIAFDKFARTDTAYNYFPNCYYLTDLKQLEESTIKQTLQIHPIEWLTICTPNDTHSDYIRYGLNHNINVICEKPVTLSPDELTNLEHLEIETGKEAYTILQMRFHEKIVALKHFVDQDSKDKTYNITLTYIASRDQKFYDSWKGDLSKSGGISTDIGIHFFDMLQWIFGPIKQNIVHVKEYDCVAGYIECLRARIRYFLSTNAKYLPLDAIAENKMTYRMISIDGRVIDFSNGFESLHTLSYERILTGHGFRISEARPSIELTYNIRYATPIGLHGDYHPFARKTLSNM